MIAMRLITPMARVNAVLEKAPQIFEKHIERALSALGEKYVNIIRARSGAESWYDRSGNLRSSIGAAVYNKGKVLMQTAFAPVLHGGIGSAKGRQVVSELAHQYSDVMALALIAGMDYAENVEALDAKDVLASASIGIEREAQTAINNAVREAEKEVQRLFDSL